jgi:hypothetical protein
MLLILPLTSTEFVKFFQPRADVIGLLVLYPLFHGSVFHFSAVKAQGSAGKEGNRD